MVALTRGETALLPGLLLFFPLSVFLVCGTLELGRTSPGFKSEGFLGIGESEEEDTESIAAAIGG